MIRLVDIGEAGPVRSQSVYHGLGYAQKSGTPDTIVLAQPDSSYMCIGFFQDADHELNGEYCRLQNIPIIRRETGGGAVYIDQNQVFTQWIFQSNSLPRRIDQRFQLFLKPMVDTLKHFGIDAYYYPINDVHVGGRKIVGTGAATIGNADVITGNFLFDFDYQIMTNALRVPDDNFKEQVRTDLRQYLTTISEQLNNIPEKQEVKKVYLRKCSEVLGTKIENGDFTIKELKAIEGYDNKLADADWVYKNQNRDTTNRILKIHAAVWIGQSTFISDKGNVEVLMSLKDNSIENIDFKTDFHQELSFELKDFERSLKYTELTTESVAKSVDTFFTANEISETGIDAGEWTEAIMKVKSLQQKFAGNGFGGG